MNKKLKKTLQCTMCAVLSFGMVVCNSSFVEAKKIKKQENTAKNDKEGEKKKRDVGKIREQE